MAFAPSSRKFGNPVGAAIKPVLEQLEQRTLLSVSLADDGILTIDGTDGDDKVVVKPLGKTRIRVVDDGEQHDFDKKAVRRIVFDGGAGDDSFHMTNYGGKHDPRVFARGGDGDDVIATGLGNDKLYGDAGDDLLSVGGGDNYANGGAGDDTIVARAGEDHLRGGPGADQISGHGDDDQVIRPGSGEDSTAAFAPRFPIITYTLDPAGYTPRMQRNAYGLGALDDPNYKNRGQGQAIAIVGAFDLPDFHKDINTFAREYDLPSMSRKQLRVINMAPKSRRLVDEGWYGEAVLDAQWAHAIAPKARIYMVQAATNARPDIRSAIQKAKRLLNNGFGGGVISLSLGSDNDTELTRVLDTDFRGADTRYISFVVSSGDTGGVNSTPSTHPNVVSVGGTALYLDQYGNRVAGFESLGVDPLTGVDVWAEHHICEEETGVQVTDQDFDRNAFPGGEVAWWQGGGGPSNVYEMPDYQVNRGLDLQFGGNRVTPDISWNADPATAVGIYNSLGNGGQSGWGTAGGTSAGAPQFAAMVTLANERRAERGRRAVGSTLVDRIYRMGGRGRDQFFYDIGNPGSTSVYHGSGPLPQIPDRQCSLPNDTAWVLPTFAGFDMATGWGSPNGSAVIPSLADEKVPLTQGTVRINGTFTDEAVFGGGTEWIGFNGSARVGGYGTITMPAMTSTRLYRSTQVTGGGATPITNSLFLVDLYGHDSQDGRADRNGWTILTVNGQVTEQQLNQGTGTPLKLFKHGNAVQGLGFITITEIVLTDDGGGGGGGGGEPDPDSFIVRTVPVRFAGSVGKKGQISGDFWAIGPNGERIDRSFDPNSNLGTALVRGRFRWD